MKNPVPENKTVHAAEPTTSETSQRAVVTEKEKRISATAGGGVTTTTKAVERAAARGVGDGTPPVAYTPIERAAQETRTTSAKPAKPAKAVESPLKTYFRTYSRRGSPLETSEPKAADAPPVSGRQARANTFLRSDTKQEANASKQPPPGQTSPGNARAKKTEPARIEAERGNPTSTAGPKVQTEQTPPEKAKKPGTKQAQKGYVVTARDPKTGERLVLNRDKHWINLSEVPKNGPCVHQLTTKELARMSKNWETKPQRVYPATYTPGQQVKMAPGQQVKMAERSQKLPGLAKPLSASQQYAAIKKEILEQSMPEIKKSLAADPEGNSLPQLVKKHGKEAVAQALKERYPRASDEGIQQMVEEAKAHKTYEEVKEEKKRRFSKNQIMQAEAEKERQEEIGENRRMNQRGYRVPVSPDARKIPSGEVTHLVSSQELEEIKTKMEQRGFDPGKLVYYLEGNDVRVVPKEALEVMQTIIEDKQRRPGAGHSATNLGAGTEAANRVTRSLFGIDAETFVQKELNQEGQIAFEKTEYGRYSGNIWLWCRDKKTGSRFCVRRGGVNLHEILNSSSVRLPSPYTGL